MTELQNSEIVDLISGVYVWLQSCSINSHYDPAGLKSDQILYRLTDL